MRSQVVGGDGCADAGGVVERSAAADLRIRVAFGNDAGTIRRIHQAAVRRLCRDHYTEAEIEAWVGGRKPRDYRYAMRDGGERLYVAERSGAVAGFASLKEGRVMAVFVDPDTGRGLGAVLLAKLESEARQVGHDELTLDASLNAVPFYARAGFESLRTAWHQVGDGSCLRCVRMRKRL